jgi:hypothetical protein
MLPLARLAFPPRKYASLTPSPSVPMYLRVSNIAAVEIRASRKAGSRLEVRSTANSSRAARRAGRTGAGVLRKGDYDYEILDACERKSSRGNDMFEITVRVLNGNGAAHDLTDYLLPTRSELLNSCSSCGLLDKYNSGLLTADDFPGRLRLGVEKKRGFRD